MNISTVQNTEAAEASTRVGNAAPVRLLEPAASSTEDKAAATSQKNIKAKEAEEIVEALNEYMDDLQTNLGFSIRKDLENQVVVEIKNRQTDELVRQIPSEELLTIMENMKELNGIIFDQSV